MQTAFAKHAPRADLRSYALRAALLGVWAALALPASSALANTTGGASAKSAAVAPESQSGGASTTAGSTTSGTAGSTTTSDDATTSGGAAPVEPQATHKRTLATWFGPGFYGNKTACGQTMSPVLVGVASRTLPCGTLVRIGYRGHQLTVPVVDRGPYGHIGAVWDLTAGTARALSITETVRVTTAIVGSLPNSPTLGEPAEAAPAASGAPSAASSTGGAAAS